MLNSQQQNAVTYTTTPLLVLAGAGCGKTRVITEKMAYLVNTGACPVERIFAITFTNKAAKEMSERAASLVKGGERIRISTFHALGLKILQQEINHTPYHAGFSILDSTETQKIIKDLLPSGIKKEVVNQLQWQISGWKNAGLSPSQTESSVPMAIELYQHYIDHMQHINAMDFDDLILQSLWLLQQNEGVRKRWQSHIGYLMVDEYQDTNASQYQMLRALMGSGVHLTCVGDDDQSIYGWRGAQPENLQLLQQDFPSLKVQKLEQNYRSSSTILEAANAVVQNNPHPFEKKIWSDLGTGDAIQILAYDSPEAEAETIITDIMFHNRVSQLPYSDFAILYRSNHQAKLFEQQLRGHNLPYQMSGGRSFFDYAEIKDMMAYLRLLVNPRDNAAFLRVINTPKRGIGLQSVKHITGAAAKQKMTFLQAAQSPHIAAGLTPSVQKKLSNFCHLIKQHQKMKGSPIDIADSLFKQLDFVNWVNINANNKVAKISKVKLVKDCLKWIKALSKNKASNLDELMNYLSLQTSNDEEEGESGISMMTLHAAKGLEFSQVYMVGVEEGILPHRNSIADDEDNGGEQGVEEERRLMYVGMTRAMNNLRISYIKKRKSRFGEDELGPKGASRFLDEIPHELAAGHPGVKKSEADQKEQSQQNFDAIMAMLKE